MLKTISPRKSLSTQEEQPSKSELPPSNDNLKQRLSPTRNSTSQTLTSKLPLKIPSLNNDLKTRKPSKDISSENLKQKQRSLSKTKSFEDLKEEKKRKENTGHTSPRRSSSKKKSLTQVKKKLFKDNSPRSSSPKQTQTSKTMKSKSSKTPKKNKPHSPRKTKRSNLHKSSSLRVPKNSPELSFFSSEQSRSSSVEKSHSDNDVAVKDHIDLRCCKCCTCDRNCMQDATGQKSTNGFSCPCAQAVALDHYKAERDFYMNEYKRLSEQPKSTSYRTDSRQHPDLLQKLNEKEKEIASLLHDNKMLAQEKHNLMTRLETARDRIDGDYDSLSSRSAIRKLERERDILKNEISRIEEERDVMKQRLKLASESQIAERERVEKSLLGAEEQIRKLEQERRDLMQTQGTRRATINGLEDQCEALKEQLRVCQTELNHQRGLCTQLKTLQEQTDKALADSQGQIAQLEKELEKSHVKIQDLEKDKSDFSKEVVSLKNDMKIMKGNLTQIDQEKDGLLMSVDDKTERLAMLEQELRSKENKNAALETALTDLKKRLNMTMDSSSAREQLLRSASVESANLRQELESAIRAKDSAIQENRRIQDDLAAVTTDCRSARNELEICRRQVEDLKRQLQHYVAEVKRFEDLMDQKELERTELLDQFRNLSQEATILESNNHTLENEAAQSKVQLSVTLDHVSDLEMKLQRQDSLIADYEKQITELTSQVSNLEGQLDHCKQQQERTETELVSIRDLCMKLDKQKDNLMRELNDKDEQRSQFDRDMGRLRRESDTLQSTLAKDRMSLENVEKLLSEARQENVELTLYNQELQSEIRMLKEKIDELQSRLISTSDQLDFYQERALDYSQQNKQLRRDVANERFFRAKEEEGKKYPSL